MGEACRQMVLSLTVQGLGQKSLTGGPPESLHSRQDKVVSIAQTNERDRKKLKIKRQKEKKTSEKNKEEMSLLKEKSGKQK